MQTVEKLLIVLLAAASTLALIGCGAKTEAGSDPKTAAINGAEATTDAKPQPAATSGKETKPVAASVDPLHPVVVIDTSMGSITITLDKQSSPLTVENFLAYIASGHYDNTVFHQVLKDYVVMGGAYTPDLREKPARAPIRNEAHNRQKNVRGAVSMVRRPDVTDSSTCQFFISISDNPNLDYVSNTPEKYGYCVFGHVNAESMTVVDKIAAVPVTDKPDFERTPVQPVVIKSIRRVR